MTSNQKRQEIERKVVRHLIREMKKAGWVIDYVHDGEEKTRRPNETQAMETVFSVDDCHIRFMKGAADRTMYRTAMIILGNDGYDCIADHSVSNPDVPEDDFQKVMDLVSDYAESLA